jgi:hypothetical protein
MGTNEIILDTLFQKQTYTALFKKQEWQKAGKYIVQTPARVKALFHRKKAK